jgi:CHAT domain-containing protein/Flp pilus assembly protein TadD
MRYFSLAFVLVFLLIGSFSQVGDRGRNSYWHNYLLADKLFNEAEQLASQPNYNEEKEEATNGKSLSLFRQAMSGLEKSGNDSLIFFCHLKTGLLWHYFDSIQPAKAEYLQAIATKDKTAAVADSFLFQPLLFAGSIYYRMNEFDSAYFFYKKAEAIGEKYDATLKEEQRLYNWLGGMYYETGNYKQAKNYFEKAIALLSPASPYYTDFLVKYKINIASSLVKLEKFAEADSIYESILLFNINTNEILQNRGIVNLRLGNPAKAVGYLTKVHYNNNLNIPLYNQLGKAYWMIGKRDSAQKYFDWALAENQKWNGSKKNIRHGFTFQYQGEKCMDEGDQPAALKNFQHAILQFYPEFNDTSIYKNPEHFSGAFSYIDLFKSLTAKADAFEQWYQHNHQQAFLNASLDAYEAAFKLSDYIEKTYDSDDARLFLNQIKYFVHDRPIHTSLRLFELTRNNKYLEAAYHFDQQNKASILALNAAESVLKNQPGINEDLVKKEATLKSAITRLSLKLQQSPDSSQLRQIGTFIRDYEIQLGKVRQQMNEQPGYRTKILAPYLPSSVQVQRLLGKSTALLSYHLAQKELVTLCITSDDFSYHRQTLDSVFFNSIELLKKSLNSTGTGKRYDGDASAVQLYDSIITPVWDKIKSFDRLLIIPDDELNNLPFEALMDKNGNYLSEKFIVQYLYSTAFLKADDSHRRAGNSLLAFAPFSDNGYGIFSKLTFSKNEVETLTGKILLDTAATKNRFLALADSYRILHLATHTIINDTVPERSLIAFYPTLNGGSNEGNLYVQEVYNMKLDATRLIILSACETGTGKLARGEGLMSLSRAFTYAGCPNIIASLWKADDQSTAWIIKRFYQHLSGGEDAAFALQKAKLDYLRSPEVDKRFKTPDYWAHLVLTGVPEARSSVFHWEWIAGLLIVLVVSASVYWKRRR